jgi:hypothetical protein
MGMGLSLQKKRDTSFHSGTFPRSSTQPLHTGTVGIGEEGAEGEPSSALSAPPAMSGTTYQSSRRPSFAASERSFSGVSTGTDANLSVREGVTLEGLLIRKHLTERDDVRAKNRRWVKVWCVMAIDDDRGVELTMFKVDSGHGDGEINFDSREITDYGKAMGSLDAGSADSIGKKVLRVSLFTSYIWSGVFIA